LDDQIADLLTELEKRGMGANTLVVMAGDHGESFGEHGLVQHNNALYMDTIHVPLIFFWPGKVPQSIRVKQPVSLASIPATLLDLCGQRSHSAFEAASLKPLFEPGGPTSWPSPRSEMAQLPYSFSNPGDPILYGRMTSIVRERWHYILHEHTGEELYDWSSDPEETKDLSHTPEAQEVLAEFRKQLRSR
jgi:choline-sulfatase